MSAPSRTQRWNTARRIDCPNDAVGNRESVALRIRRVIREPRPTKLSMRSSRCATAGLLENIIVHGIDGSESDSSNVGVRYANAERFFDAHH
jgi:hypothetical protein